MAKKKNKGIRIMLNMAIVMFAAIFLFSGYKVYTIWHEYDVNAKNTEQLQSIFHATTIEHENSTVQKLDAEDAQIDTAITDGTVSYSYTSFSLQPLIDINPDTVAWLTVPGANIDHVVVQCSNDSYYLWRSFYEEENSCGTPFMECENKIGEPLQNYVIYGHRMRDGSMFAHLDVLLDQEFVDENPTFTIYMADGEYECQIFAVYRCLIADNYLQFSFDTEEEMENYIEQCKRYSEIKTDVKVTAQDQIVTLSTCDRSTDPEQGRLVVQAKMVKVSASGETPSEEE